jgi:hypothetical protein
MKNSNDAIGNRTRDLPAGSTLSLNQLRHRLHLILWLKRRYCYPIPPRDSKYGLSRGHIEYMYSVWSRRLPAADYFLQFALKFDVLQTSPQTADT